MGTDREIVRIAERRSNVVTDRDLQRLGLNQRAIQRRAADGTTTRLTGGVYAVGPISEPLVQLRLALCLTYPELVVSHSSAAAYWGLRRVRRDLLEVTVPTTSRIRTSPAVVHYSNHLPGDHIVDTIDGLRVTSVARTVFDLGGVLDTSGHRSLIEDVRNQGLATDDELGDVYHTLCGKGRRGSAAWDRLKDITSRTGRPTMSEYELQLQDALVAAGMSAAVQQHPVELPSGRLVKIDLAYPDARLALEVDHTAWHNTASAIERDKTRDLELAHMDWLSLRFTERMLDRMPMCVHHIQTIHAQRIHPDVAAA